MADATDSAPPNVPNRITSLRPNNNSAGHLPLTQQDSYTSKGGAGKGRKDSKKRELVF